MGMLVKGPAPTTWCGGPTRSGRRAAGQIEALRRPRFPRTSEEVRLGAARPADGPVKRAIFGENSARLYKYDAKRRAELTTDRITLAERTTSAKAGRTNLRYGFVVNRSARARRRSHHHRRRRLDLARAFAAESLYGFSTRRCPPARPSRLQRLVEIRSLPRDVAEVRRDHGVGQIAQG